MVAAGEVGRGTDEDLGGDGGQSDSRGADLQDGGRVQGYVFSLSQSDNSSIETVGATLVAAGAMLV